MVILCIITLGMNGYGSSAQGAQNDDNACAGGYSSQFVLTGEVNNPTAYDEESLGALPHSIENVTFLTKTGPQSASYGGVLLWNLLTAAGIKTDPTRDGQFQYVEITATDCYQVVLALGELDPNFGGEQVLVADSQNGSPLGPDSGFARIIVPGDKFGGRDTFWIRKIKVLSGPPPH
ncbi:MAG: molybdopterin-dependent oxidoreductase [Acidobacteriaceae bacterium]|nr:molybdopterin-dependent oxidoreductase [Acidobacteriaceae bacterium]MBV9498620.1 molybdopterin-dependent oxidoreductase [Acidobacteriaceae bacterium]